MKIQPGPIEGVIVRDLAVHRDTRGWLAELYRSDELPAGFSPAMAYASVTLPGVVRGPHEHVDQADLFACVGPGEFLLTLWDNRPDSPTRGNRMEVRMGAQRPGSVQVPRGVAHAYRCLGPEPGLVLNCPDRLFRGEGRSFPVDEIRHEDDPGNPFVQDERARRDLA